jgi:hypothetical protein
MTAENIGVGVHYLSIPEHPYYQKTYGWTEDYPMQCDRSSDREFANFSETNG